MMTTDPEVFDVLIRHLEAIQHNDLDAYHETTSEDLTLYEWWITPHRIDGLPFHDFMMTENAQRGTVFGAVDRTGAGDRANIGGSAARTRFDLANLRIQRYGDAAIASYTLLTSTSGAGGVTVAAHNESRVLVKQGGQWKVVHAHKSPAYSAPHIDDRGN